MKKNSSHKNAIPENEIISYLEMCQREGVSLQRGMNYRIGKSYSVLLMSLRPNAPYADQVIDDGTILIYEGHDIPRNADNPNPKLVNQPEYTRSGKLTENGKFHNAAQEFKRGSRQVEIVRVYEKIKQGIWSFNGTFKLIDSWIKNEQARNVFKFKLELTETSPDGIAANSTKSERSRVIPTSVKLSVWKRDQGKCVICSAEDELHFDHIIPYSKGGTSLSAENIQLLCARHNLNKRDKIE